MTADPAAAIVLVAHGSRAEAANEAHRAVADDLSGRLGVLVVAAFLELAEPSIGGGIDRAVEAGVVRVVVLPHFLYPGRHLTEDIPGAVAVAAARHPGVDVRTLDASGADPGLIELLAAQAGRALAD